MNQVHENTTSYEIRSGSENKMYTLWRFNSFNGRETYIKNLSADFDKAVEEAKRYAKGRELNICVGDELNDIVRGEDVLRFGKYKDRRICEIDDVKYLSWLSKGGPVRDEAFDTWNYYFDNDKQLELVKIRLAELGELIEYEGEYYTSKQLERVKFEKSFVHGHFYDEKKRVTLNLRVLSSTHFDTQWGTTWILKMVDENLRVFTYKGSGDVYELLKSRHHDVQIWFNISGTVDHNEYRGQKQTMLKRLKINPSFISTSDGELNYLI